MKPMDMAEALFGNDGGTSDAPEGSVDTSAMAAIAAHLAREDAGAMPASVQAGRDEDETREGGVTLLGNQRTNYPTDYDPLVLETFENKHPGNDYFVKFNCPEFTSLCPITGQPDFATVYISYVPDVRMVESKSLKLYLFSFRNHGDFHEDCMNIIMKDLVALMDPKYIEVWGKFTPRGGISIDPYCNYGRPGTRWEEVAWTRLSQHDLYPEKVDNR
ncbi:preQ(1) synthase [Adlercreutzia shanghongiae]